MSDKTKQAKQAKQAATSWTAPTSVLYDRVLSPMYDEVARVLWPAWLHPNYITLLGGVFCTLSVLAMQRDAWGWSCILFTCYHACDNTDGKHARRTGKSSKFGHVLDHAVDATAGVTAITLIFEQVHTPHRAKVHAAKPLRAAEGKVLLWQPAPALAPSSPRLPPTSAGALRLRRPLVHAHHHGRLSHVPPGRVQLGQTHARLPLALRRRGQP